MPDAERMAAYSRTVYECSPLRQGDPTGRAGPSRCRAGNPIPARVGDPSPIKYVIYIIKENRTYDQVFGDIPKATATPIFASFPRPSLPTTMPWPASSCCSTTSTSTARSAPMVTNGRWALTPPTSSSGPGRLSTGATGASPIPRRANLPWPDRRRATSGTARPRRGSATAAMASSSRTAGRRMSREPRPVKALQGHFDPFFRSFDLDYPDVKRAERFLEELAGFEKAGDDAPAGRRCGCPTITPPEPGPARRPSLASLADNDLALGQVVEGLSKSRFWKELAIFVVEDDAQNGSDHVDAHRTVALAISPYIKRHAVDSTMYSTSSMLRTMELILGLEPMSQFDAAARPMFDAFTPEADFTALCPPPGPRGHQRQEHAARPHGRAVAAARPRDRGPRR